MFNFFSNAQIGSNVAKYNSNDFIFRLKKIEKICVKDNIDGFLVINGIDARENTEYVKLTNWLFLGHSGLEISENEYLNAVYADMIVLIKKGVTHIFIHPEGLQYLSPLIYSIPNVDVFCPTEIQYEDKDELELLKMAFFLRIMKPTKRVGVLLGKKENGKLSSIEKWPLIQSYGLEEIGAGFFSMTHEVVDLTARLNAVYKNYDKYCVSKLINVVGKRLTGHFTSAAGQLGDLKMHKRALASEKQLTDIFRDTYEIEEISKWVQQRGISSTLPKPRVLFGKNTIASASQEPSETLLKDLSYSEGFNAFHATFETFDLRTCLRAARTYFLTTGAREEKEVVAVEDDEGVTQQYDLALREVPENKDQDFMVNLYLSMVIGFSEVMQLITKDYRNMTEEFVQEYIYQKIIKVVAGFKAPEDQIKKENIVILLRAYNSFGEEVKIDFQDTISFKLTPIFFMQRIELTSMKSLLKPNITLGSLVFAESFFLQEGCYLLLTKEIPYFDLWNCQNQFSEKIEKLKKRIVWEPLGQQITESLPKNRVFVHTGRKSNYGFDVPLLDANYIHHQLGLRIETTKLGWILIFFKDMKNIQITQKLRNTWLIFTLESSFIFNSISKETVALEFTGNALEQSLFKIKQYFDDNKIPYEYVVDTPVVFNESLIARKQILNLPSQKLIQMNCIQNEAFFISYIEDKQLMILNAMKDLKLSAYKSIYENIQQNQAPSASTPPESRIGVIFVNGSYCSGKGKFVQSLIRFGSDNNLKLHLLKFENNDLNTLTEKTFMSALRKLSIDKKIQAPEVIVAAIPHFINSKVILDYFSKSETISASFYLRCVATKININNFYADYNKNLVENVITLCVDGYSQFLLLDSFNNYDADVNAVNNILKGALPKANIFKIMNNILNPSLAKDILTSTAFTSESNNLSRLKYAVQYDIPQQTEKRIFFVPFKLPVLRDKLREVIQKKIMQKGFQTYVDTTEAEQKIEEFKRINKDSTDPLMVELIKLKEKIELQNARESKEAMKIDFIKAILRYDGKLKNGLQEITVTPHYFIEKDVKGVTAIDHLTQVEETDFKNVIYQGLTNGQIENMGFIFGGRNLTEDKIREILMKIIKPLNKLKIRTISDLSQEEITDVQFRNRGEGLENGEFYDGQFWRNISGLILPHHPKKDQLIEEYLKAEEQRINLINDQLQKEWDTWKSVFEVVLVG